jgi:hypothetical protein
MILVRTNHPCLRVWRHSWYQSYYGYNTSRTVLFSKTYYEDALRCSYKDYSSLTKWQANRDLLSAIYFSITTHRWKGNKVRILPSGDVNPGLIPSRQGLLEDSHYRVDRGCVSVVWLVMTTHLGRVDLGMSCGRSLKTWICSRNICNVVYAVLNVWAPLEG